MYRSRVLRNCDLAGIIELSIGIQEAPPDPILRRKRLLAGLRRLLNAKVGMTGLLNNFTPGQSLKPTMMVDDGWDDPQEREALVKPLSENRLYSPFSSEIAVLPEKFINLRRVDLVADHVWSNSPFAADIAQRADVDDSVVSILRLNGSGFVAGLIVARPWRDRTRFTLRDRAILQTVHQSIQWIYTQEQLDQSAVSGIPGAGVSGRLPRRLQQVLEMLCEGSSEKMIAQRMNLSPYTVHEHVKRLYHRLGVGSRGELLAKVMNPSRRTGNFSPQTGSFTPGS